MNIDHYPEIAQSLDNLRTGLEALEADLRRFSQRGLPPANTGRDVRMLLNEYNKLVLALGQLNVRSG